MSSFRRQDMRNKSDQGRKKIKNVTLQVRIPRKLWKCRRKRAFPSAFQTVEGSMTIETALVLPLFLFAMMTLVMMFDIMDRQRQVQSALESVCEDISKYAYGAYEIGRGETKIKMPEEEFQQYFSGGRLEQAAALAYAELRLRSRLSQAEIRNLSLSGSSLLEDGETVDLVAAYEVKLPFPVFRIDGISMVSRSRRRAWIGKDGGSGTGDGAGEKDDIVYIGKGSTRYHVIRTCHYLYNQLSPVALADIEGYRNASGGRYGACSRCGADAGGTVYIMASGSSYHSVPSCSAIVSYVKAVKKSTVAHLGPCSYCSGGGG